MTTTPARLLVADDDAKTRALLEHALHAAGHEVVAVAGGQEAVTAFADGGFDAVLLDAVMPRVSGIEAARTIRAIQGDDVVPILLVHAKSDVESRIAALEIGADATVVKPLEEAELARTVATALRTRRAHTDLAAARRVLAEAREEDEVTGARSFAALAARLDQELVRAERHSEPLACCLLDVDALKTQNERGGRAFGDAVLRRVADVTRAALRESDVVARYGGDELFVLLPATHFAGALVVASRILRDVAKAFTVAGGGEARVTASLGVALFPSRDVRSRRALCGALETAVSEAKRRGGNRLCVFQHTGSLFVPEEAPPSTRGHVGPVTVPGEVGPGRP